MRHSAFGISIVFSTFLACDGGSKEVPAKPATKVAPAAADPAAADPPSPSAEPVVKVIRPEDEQTAAGSGPPAEKLEDLKEADVGQAYGQVLVQTRSAKTHVAELTIVRAEGVKARSGVVRYTAEPRVVVANAKTTVDESNLLGTGMSFDIDGDGKTTSKIKTKCDGGTVVLETKPSIRLDAVTELSDAVARFNYGANDARVLANDGAGALLYAPCDKEMIILGLDQSAPLKMYEVASPSVFAVYRAEVDSLDAEDPFSLEKLESADQAVAHQLYSFREVNVEGDEVKIYAAHLVVFALDPTAALQHVFLEITGEAPEFVTASINEVDADGHRIRYGDGFKPF